MSVKGPALRQCMFALDSTGKSKQLNQDHRIKKSRPPNPIPPKEQVTNSRWYHKHLFKQLYANIQIVDSHRHGLVQERVTN